MTIIQSNTVSINQSDAKVFEFLKDFKNFEKLLPPQITNWSCDSNSCSFTIEGMADIALIYGNCIANSKISFVSTGKSPISFELICNIKALTANSIDCQILMNADLNPFLKIMAERPLNNFVNALIQKLKEVSEQD